MNAIFISATYLSQFLIISVGFIVLLLMIANVMQKIKKASKSVLVAPLEVSTLVEDRSHDFQLVHHELLIDSKNAEEKEKIKPADLI